MGSLSIFHWLVFILIWLAFAIPLARLGKHVGHPSWVAYLVCVLPLGCLIYLWIVAYSGKLGRLAQATSNS